MFRPLVVTGERRSGTNLVADLLGDQEHLTLLRDFLHLARIMRKLRIPSLTTLLSQPKRRQVAELFERQSALVLRPEELDWEAFHRLPIEPWGDLRDLHRRVLETVARAGDLIVGHKTTMAMPILPELLRASPQCHAIVVIRDPRTAVASSMHHLPGLSVYDHIEAWRSQYRHLQRLQRPDLASRVLLLRYEHLVARPQAELDTVARFLDIPRMWVPASLDGLGTSWAGDVPAEAVVVDGSTDVAVDVACPDPVAAVVEAALGPLMRMHGYEPGRASTPRAELAYTGGLLRHQAARLTRRAGRAVTRRVRPMSARRTDLHRTAP